MARACACVKSTLLVVGIWLNQGKKQERRAIECVWETRSRGRLRSTRSGVTGKSACATVSKRDAGSINSKELRVNKRDSPRISKEIHIDRKQPLGVSLKGSPKQVLANCGLDKKPE
jgi:hypothetical protein